MKRLQKRAFVIISIIILSFQIDPVSSETFFLPSETEFLGYGTNATISFQNTHNITFSSINNTELYIECNPEAMNGFQFLFSFYNLEEAYVFLFFNDTDDMLGIHHNMIFRDTSMQKYRFSSGFMVQIGTNVSAEIEMRYISNDLNLVWVGIDAETGEYYPVNSSFEENGIHTSFIAKEYQYFFLASPINETVVIIITVCLFIIGCVIYIYYLRKKSLKDCSNGIYDKVTGNCEKPIIIDPTSKP